VGADRSRDSSDDQDRVDAWGSGFGLDHRSGHASCGMLQRGSCVAKAL